MSALRAIETPLTALLAKVTTVSDCVRDHATPVLKSTLDDGQLSTGLPVYKELLDGFVGLASASQDFDGNGPSVRYNGGYGEQLVSTGTLPSGDRLFGTSAAPLLGSRPRPPAKQPPFRPDVPCTSQDVPKLDASAAAAGRRAAPRHAAGGDGPEGRAACPADRAEGRALSFARQLRRHAIELGAVLFLVVCAGAVGAYVLAHQRVRFPWQHVYTIKADFTSAAAVAPGQGQTVDVAGVKVGEIGKVTLHDGHARIELQIRRDKLPAVYSDARALLRPKTGLQDMSVDLDPGTSRARKLGDGDVLPVAQTLPDVHMDEILSALDADTRAWLQTMLQAGGRGLDGRAGDLRALFKAGAPTLRSSRQLTDAINGRRRELSRLVHNLRVLQRSGAAQDDDIRSIVVRRRRDVLARSPGTTRELRASLDRLPGTLEAARGALAAARPFARDARRRRCARCEPAVRDLGAVLPKVDPLLRDARPAASRIRGLVHKAVPSPATCARRSTNLNAVTPHLSNAFSVLNYVVNELGYNPDGPEEGYLFWTAWFFHNADSILSIEDAQGAAWRGGLITSCSTLAALPQTNPEMALLMPQLPVCPKDASR